MASRPTDPSVLEAKKALIAEASQAKKTRLDPVATAAEQAASTVFVPQYDDADLDQVFEASAEENAQRQKAAAKSYMPSGKDLITSGARGINAHVNGILSTALANVGKLASPTDAGLAIVEKALELTSKKALPLHTPGTVAANKVGRAAADHVLKGSRQVDEVLQQQLSLESRVNERAVQEQMAADAAENQALYEEALARGDNEAAAELLRLGRGIRDAAGATLDNPNYLVNATVQQVPSLAAGVLGRAAVKQGDVRSRAEQMLEAQGLKALDKQVLIRDGVRRTTQDARGTAVREARDELATRNMQVATGLMEGGGAFQQTHAEVMGMDPQTFIETFPEGQALIAQHGFEEARSLLAHQVANNAGAMAGIATAGIARIAGKFEIDPLNLGQRNPISDMLREGVEEGLQGGAGEMSGNLAMRNEGADVGVLDGVGEVVGQGAVLGSAMAGGLSGASTALRTTAAIPLAAVEGIKAAGNVLAPVLKGTGKAVAAVGSAAVKGAGKLAEGRANQVRDGLAAGTTARSAEAREQTTNELRGALADRESLGLEETPIDLSPKMAEELGDVDPASLDQLSIYSAIIDRLAGGEEAALSVSPTLLAYAGAVEDNLRRLARQTRARLDSEQDPDTLEALTTVNQKVTALLENTLPVMQVVRDEKYPVSPELIASITAAASHPDNTGLNENELQAVEILRSKILSGQTKDIPAEAIKQVRVYSAKSLDPVESQIMEQAEAVAAERERHQGELAKLKSIKSVGVEIRSGGFDFMGKKLNSLEDFATEVMALTGLGQTNAAGSSLDFLRKWASHASTRLDAFNARAMEQLDGLEQGKGLGGKLSLPYRQLKADGQSLDVDRPAFVMLGSEGGRELGRAIEEDTRAIVRTYNSLVNLLPEAQRPAPLPEVADAPWRARYATLAANPTAAPATPTQQAEQAPASKEAASEAASKPAESAATPQAAPAKTEGRTQGSGERASDGEQASSEAGNQITSASEPAPEPAPIEVPKPAIDFVETPLASDEELDAALALTNDDYIQAVSDGVVTAPTKAKAIRDELAGLVAPDDAPEIAKVDGTSVVLKAAGNYLYAVDTAVKDEDGDPVTAGVLYHAEAGTTLMVHPDGNYRGKGIGEALMTELLRRKPMAKSNGLSPAARQLRLKVMGKLRAERNQPSFASLEERFPGLSTAPVGSGKLARNRLLLAFQLSRNSASLFVRELSPMTRLREAFGAGTAGLKTFLGYQPGEQEQRALARLYSLVRGARSSDRATVLPGLIETMDRLLDERFQKQRKSLYDADKGLDKWNFADQMVLHLGERYVDEAGVERMRVQPQLAEGIAVGGLRWMIESMNRPNQFFEDTVAKLYPNRVIPPEFLVAHQKHKAYATESGQLANTILETLGLQTDDSANGTSTNGLPLTMAATFMDAVAALGLVDVIDMKPADAFADQEATLLKQKPSKERDAALAAIAAYREKMGGRRRKFLRFDEDAPNKVRLSSLNEALGGSTALLDKVFGGFNEHEAQLGKPSKRVNTKVKGVNVEAGEQQIQALKVLGQIAHRTNTAMSDRLFSLSDDLQQRLFGALPYDPETASQAYLPQLRGLEAGARRTLVQLRKLRTRTEQYAETAKKAVKDVPLFWSYRVNSNGRLEQQGFGGQSNKWARELYPTKLVQMNLRDAKVVKHYWLALAQALDVKVETKSHEASTKEIQDAVDGALLPLLTQFVEAEEAGRIEAPEQFVEAFLAAGFGNPARAFNALQTHARFLLHTDTSKPFETGLVFEVDGKTDGPINALMQFGLTHLGGHLLRQLAQGGLFLGQVEGGTLNENFDKDNPDLYTNPLRAFNAALKGLLADRTLPPELRDVFRSGLQGLRRVRRLNDQLEGVRTLFKEPFTQKTYGAGDDSIVKSAAKDVAGHYGKLIHEALQRGELLAPEVRDEILKAFAIKVNRNEKTDALWMSTEFVMPLNTLADYKRFKVLQGNIDALTSQYVQGMGKLMTAEINHEMAPVDHTLSAVYRLTAMQGMAYSNEFARRYDARRKELYAAGELARDDALSKQEERRILDQIKHLEPVFHAPQTQGGHGITLVNGRDSGSLPDVAKVTTPRAVQTVGAGGGFSSDIPVSRPEAAVGVRAAALMTIATGDASMMTQVFQTARSWFDVHDGLEVPIDEIDEASRTVNAAVWENWMFNMLESMQTQFAQFEYDFSKLDNRQLGELIEALHLTPEEKEVFGDKLTREDAIDYLTRQVNVLRGRVDEARRVTAAVKQAMSEVGSSTDHMAGPMAPHVREGRVFENREAMLDFLWKRSAEILGQVPPTFVETLEKEDVEWLNKKPYVKPEPATTTVVKLPTDPQAPTPVVPQATQLGLKDVHTLLNKVQFKDKVGGYVYHRIRKLLPEDLVILHGTQEALQHEVDRRFPGVMLDTSSNGWTLSGQPPVVLLKQHGEKRALRVETLLHELVHVVTMHTIERYYDQNGAGLTQGQKQAVQSLEQMALHFINLPKDTLPPAAQHMQSLLRGFQQSGDNTSMVSELLAWGLTNPTISAHLKSEQGVPFLRKLGRAMITAVRKILGLPENAPVDSFLGQLLDQMGRITRRPVATKAPNQGMLVLRQAQQDTDEALEELLQQLDELLMTLPETQEELERAVAEAPEAVLKSRTEIRFAGAQAAKAMADAEFYMTPAQELGFLGVHAVITSMATVDPQAVMQLEDLRAQAMQQIRVEHLLEEGEQLGDQLAEARARARLEALQSTTKDPYGRSQLLANFVALGMVHPQFRQILGNLRTQSTKIQRDTFDHALRTAGRKLFDLAGGAVLKTNNRSHQVVLGEMFQRIAQAQKRAAEVKPAQGWGLIGKAESVIRTGMDSAYNTFDAVADRLEGRRNAGDTSVKTAAALVATDLVSMLIAPESEGETLSKRMIRLLNTAPVGDFMRNLGAELIGTTEDNRTIHKLLNQAKMHVSQIRQRLRDQVPQLVQDLFGKQVGDAQMKLMYRSLGRTDVAVLLDTMTMAELAELMKDPAKLSAAIHAHVQSLPANMASHVSAKADGLAQWLSRKDTRDGDKLLARNAEALLLRAEKETAQVFKGTVAEREQAIATIDRLVTLKAMELLSTTEQQETAALIEQNPEAVEKTLRLLQAIKRTELEKAPDNIYRLNTWKGHLPYTLDPRRDVVLASSKYGEELERRGYKMVGAYASDRLDGRNDLYYYSTRWSGGLSTFNQGALQTVENSLMGIDTLTGQTLDPAARMLINNPDEVNAITKAKMAGMILRGPKGRGPQLLPILNQDGDVVAYERPMDSNLLNRELRQEGHLAQAIGMWLGRQTEEVLAGTLNTQVIKALHDRWLQDKRDGRADEYEAINTGPRNAVLKDTWETLPRHVQEQLQEQFGEDPVMVRKELQNNSLGYRSASVGDIFTGTTRLSPEMRQALENVAFALAGKRAYPLLVTGERAWQGLVGTAKDIIVVRSGIVAVANLLANQVQLLQMTGWNPARLLRVQLSAAKELEHYLRNKARMTEISASIGMTTDAGEIQKLQTELQGLQDGISRLSIGPLLDMGMLPTIAEGLSEQDQYTLLHDGMRWVEKKTEKLPKGVLTAAKYAIVAKDTALYQGLNRMVQFGDFMAKAALYQALMEQHGAKRKTPLEDRILDEVNESFVNYNLLPGRGRDYLESMGVTWFWNYKLRIQKIALRNFKRNPIRFLGLGLGAEWLGSDSLLSSSGPMVNWEYSVGPDQLWRSHEMLLWRGLVGW